MLSAKAIKNVGNGSGMRFELPGEMEEILLLRVRDEQGIQNHKIKQNLAGKKTEVLGSAPHSQHSSLIQGESTLLIFSGRGSHIYRRNQRVIFHL